MCLIKKYYRKKLSRMRGFEGNFSVVVHLDSEISLCIEQYECCDHSPAGLFVHAILDFEPKESFYEMLENCCWVSKCCHFCLKNKV